jgi:hypothetical protein
MTRHTTKDKLEALKRGVDLPVDPYAMAHGEVGQVPPTDERAVMRLSRAIHWAESEDCSVSWSAQERAASYFNEHGLAKTLAEAFRLEGEDTGS